MIGAKYIKVAASAVEEYYQIQKEKRAVPEPYYLPEFSPIQIEKFIRTIPNNAASLIRFSL